MTDHELIELIQHKTPEELTLEELELLQQRIKAAPELREALAEQIELDQYLADAMGRHNVPVDQIVSMAGGGTIEDTPDGASMPLWGWLVCLLTGAMVAAGLVFFIQRGPGSDEPSELTVAEKSDTLAKSIAKTEAKSPASKTLDAATKTESPDPAPKEDPKESPPPHKPIQLVEIPADQFSRGTVEVVEIEKGDSRSIEIHSRGGGNFAEYFVEASEAGEYLLKIRYATKETRPLKLAINGQAVKEPIATEMTGDLKPESHRWFEAGRHKLKKGLNLVRIETAGSLPHVSRLAIFSTTKSASKAKLALVIKKPEGPWEETLGAAPRPFEEICFESAIGFGSVISKQRLEQWWVPVAGKKLSITEKSAHDRRRKKTIKHCVLNSPAKLKAPWGEDYALRIGIKPESKGTQIYVWSGKQGVAFWKYPQGYRPWIAYTTTRQGDEYKGDSYVVAATDGMRERRYDPQGQGGTLDLRWHDGRVVLSRGDTALVSAPLESMPEAVYFDGMSMISGMTLIRSPGGPKLETARPTVVDHAKPSALKWEKSLVEGVAFKSHDDGSAELVFAPAAPDPDEKPKKKKKKRKLTPAERCWVATPLPTTGVQEIIFEIEHPQIETGVFLGSEKGPLHSLGFYVNKRLKDEVTIGYFPPGHKQPSSRKNYLQQPMPWVGERVWIRLLLAGETVKCWVSSDGQQWARVGDPIHSAVRGEMTHAGLFIHGDQGRGVKLRRLSVRSLEAINSLAPKAAREQAVALATAGNYDEWFAAIEKRRPKQFTPEQWRRACAIRTLGSGVASEIASRLVENLVEAATQDGLSAEQQLKLLDELALVLDGWSKPELARRHLNRYEELAERAFLAGELAPYSKIQLRSMTAPLWTGLDYPPPGERLIRIELLSATLDSRWADVDRFSQTLACWGQQAICKLTPWAEGMAARRLRKANADSFVALPAWRHPLITEVGKETFNVMSELAAALRGKSYRSACRIITSTPTYGLGLVPDATDRQLLMTMNGAVGQAMQQYPELQSTMKEQFGKLGTLRVRQAIQQGQEDRLLAATAQFYGTTAAAEAHQWIGDRALSRGDFSEALDRYEMALQGAPASLHGELQARRRLAAAMLGQDVGKPVSAAVQFGDTEMSTAEFEKLVAEMRTTHRRAEVGGRAGSLGATHPAPSPAVYEAISRGRIDGKIGDWKRAPKNVDDAKYDWRSKTLGITQDGQMLYVSDRLQIAAFDLSNGKRRWQSPLEKAVGALGSWSTEPMRPLVVGGRVYARRLASSGPQLNCKDASTGKSIWYTSPSKNRGGARRGNEYVASDPLMLRGHLVAITGSENVQQLGLSLTVFDSGTGDILSRRSLVQLRPQRFSHRVCGMVAVGDGLLVTFGGGVLRCDSHGHVRWIRRLPWMPWDQDISGAHQSHTRPLIVGDHVFIAQPGMRGVVCLNRETGQLVWHRTLVTVRDVWGVSADRLLVETDGTILGLDAKTGKTVWQQVKPSDMVAAYCVEGPGELMIGSNEAVTPKGKKHHIRLEWLDPATGKTKKQSMLGKVEGEQLWMAAVVSHNKKSWAVLRLDKNQPILDLVELVRRGKASPPSAAVDPWSP